MEEKAVITSTLDCAKCYYRQQGCKLAQVARELFASMPTHTTEQQSVKHEYEKVLITLGVL